MLSTFVALLTLNLSIHYSIMINQVSEKMHAPSTFSFPAIFEGREAIVTINRNEAEYGVLIDDNHFAQLQLEADFHNWFVAKGELNDADLLKEIGQRIETIYH
jgi:hypothetical protein